MSATPTVRERLIVERYEFVGFHGRRAWCGLAVLRLSDGRQVVVCSERADNPGTSVTNAAEHLATEVVRQFSLDPAKLVWVEHYPPGHSHGPAAEWDRVAFEVVVPAAAAAGLPARLAYPSWRPMRPRDWDELGLDPATLFLLDA